VGKHAPELPLVAAVQVCVHVELVFALLFGRSLGSPGGVVLGL
jgi:hypothetical protein